MLIVVFEKIRYILHTYKFKLKCCYYLLLQNRSYILHYYVFRKPTGTYRRVVFVLNSPSILSAASSICMPSVCARSLRICSISPWEYGNVRIMRSLSRRSRGIPCGEIMSSVPLQENKTNFTKYLY